MSNYAQSETIGAASAAVPGAFAPLTANPFLALAGAWIGPILGLFRHAGRRARGAALPPKRSPDRARTQLEFSSNSARRSTG